MARVLLIVPSATYRASDFLEAARALGVEVVVAGEEKHALHERVGSRTLRVPLDDPEAAAAVIVDHDALTPIDAVVAVDDRGTVAAALASQRLGLRHNPPAAVAAARDKVAMRRLLAAAEVPQPDFRVVSSSAAPTEVTRAVREVGMPCVVKPPTLSASQGVLRADSQGEALAAWRRVQDITLGAGVAHESPLLVERFVPGPEVAVEALLVDDELRVLAVFDKPEPLDGPAFEESIYVTPSRLDSEDLKAVTATAAAATRALGLRTGPVHAELRVGGGRAVVIEVAARTIGGLCSRALTFATGQTLEQLVLQRALGVSAPVPSLDAAVGVLMVPVPAAGTLVAVEGRREALGVPGITDVRVTVPIGGYVAPAPEGDRYLGFVFARARRPQDVERALRQARALLRVHVHPQPPPRGTRCGERLPG